jgi:hypothetical protein
MILLMSWYRAGEDRSGEGDRGKSQAITESSKEGWGRGFSRPFMRATSVSAGIKSERKKSFPAFRYTERLNVSSLYLSRHDGRTGVR